MKKIGIILIAFVAVAAAYSIFSSEGSLFANVQQEKAIVQEKSNALTKTGSEIDYSDCKRRFEAEENQIGEAQELTYELDMQRKIFTAHAGREKNTFNFTLEGDQMLLQDNDGRKHTATLSMEDGHYVMRYKKYETDCHSFVVRF